MNLFVLSPRWISRRVAVITVAAGMAGCFVGTIFAKGGNQNIPLYLFWHPAEAIVLAKFDDHDGKKLVIEKSYYGLLKAGDQILLSDTNRNEFHLLPPADDQAALPQLLLFMVHKHLDKAWGYELPVGEQWTANLSASKQVIDGKVYGWSPRHNDETADTLPYTESEILYGLKLHDLFLEAKDAHDSQQKLALLRTFLVPSDDGRITPYMVWNVTTSILDEADKTGSAVIPFYEELLKLPSYQPGFNPDGWIGFGAQEQVQVEQRLQLQKAHSENDPAKKLAELAPVFILPEFECRAGCDGDYLLDQAMDKALVEAATAGPAAISFLQDLLTRPYFQDGVRHANQDVGHERRQKIEATLAQLQSIAR